MAEQSFVKTTTYGKLRGLQMNGYQFFKGIRYARAQRFQKPVLEEHAGSLVTSTMDRLDEDGIDDAACYGRCLSRTDDRLDEEGVYDATRFGNCCPQPGQKPGSFYDREFWHHKEYITEKNEDCLFLNIWKPDHGEKHPVAIWYHGGAYMNGFGHKVEVDGEYFTKKGIVLVSVNYRLGILGFLTASMLDQAYGYSGNYAVYDQICAIEWVRRNIADFGGDPDHITLMGQSAGAMSVQTLIGAPILPKGVVGAVMESGGGIRNWMNESKTKEEMQPLHEELLQSLGLDTLDKLLAADPMWLVMKSAAYTAEKAGGRLVFFPVMSEDVLPASYEELVEKDRIPDIPYIIGCTKDDITVTGDYHKSPIYQGCLNMADPILANHKSPVYLYVFCREPLGGEGQGSFHSSELWYTFHTLNRSWREKDEDDYRIADEMNQCWSNFILTGNPNGLAVADEAVTDEAGTDKNGTDETGADETVANVTVTDETVTNVTVTDRPERNQPGSDPVTWQAYDGKETTIRLFGDGTNRNQKPQESGNIQYY